MAQEPPSGAKLPILSEEEQTNMLAVGTALRNIGWLSFWSQLALTVVSAVILLFSVGVTGQVGGVSAAVRLCFLFVAVPARLGGNQQPGEWLLFLPGLLSSFVAFPIELPAGWCPLTCQHCHPQHPRQRGNTC